MLLALMCIRVLGIIGGSVCFAFLVHLPAYDLRLYGFPYAMKPVLAGEGLGIPRRKTSKKAIKISL